MKRANLDGIERRYNLAASRPDWLEVIGLVAEIHALREVEKAARELENFLTHDVGMDKLELTNLRFILSKLPAIEGGETA